MAKCLCGSSEKTKDLIWTNPSPNVEFAAQKVSVDLSRYKYIEYVVKARGQAPGVNPATTFKAPKGATSFIVISEKNTAITTRVVTAVDDASITFGDGCYYSFSDGYKEPGGNYAVPVEIYGIK